MHRRNHQIPGDQDESGGVEKLHASHPVKSTGKPNPGARFFAEFGVPSDRADARERSVSSEILGEVVAKCKGFGMHVRE